MVVVVVLFNREVLDIAWRRKALMPYVVVVVVVVGMLLYIQSIAVSGFFKTLACTTPW